MKCNASIDGQRCGYTADDLAEHAAETGHLLCIVCTRSLRHDERQTCQLCIQRTRDALTAIRDAYPSLQPAVEATALHPGALPGGTALVMLADGNSAALKPYRPSPAPDAPDTEYVEFADHPAYMTQRPLPDAKPFRPAARNDGKEHYADHWDSDPTVPLAVLEANERDWRLTFGHPAADDLATIDNTSGYLLRWLTLAARTHPAFDEFAAEIRDLAATVVHVTGLANDPVIADAPCFDCGGRLVSGYRDPSAPTVRRDRLRVILAQRDAERTYAGNGLTVLTPLDGAFGRDGSDSEGLDLVTADDGDIAEPIWTCADCDRTYEPATYWLAVRSYLENRAS